MNSQTRSIALGVACVLLIALGVVVGWHVRPTNAQTVDQTLTAPISGQVYSSAAQDTITGSRRNAIVVASQRVAPAVVSVNVLRRETIRPRSIWDEMFFSDRLQRDVQGLGSGFIIRADGLVLTNAHVVGGATEIVVTLADGRDFGAELVGVDETVDIALLRLKGASGLPVAPLGTANNLIIGEWAIAIGNPFGFLLSNAEPTVTAGVVSGVGRNIVPSDGERSQGLYLDMIQTDASINQGNSGGPLVNAVGQVIGVNSSIISGSGGSIGLGFAIPIDRARRVVADLLAEGRVRRVWIGADVKAAEPNAFGRSRRVQINEVASPSPAAAAGLRAGMTVLRVGARPVYTPLDWEARLIDARVGEPLDIVVAEGNRERTVRVRPTDVPSLAAERVRALSDEFQLVTVTAAIRAERRIQSESGALILELSPEAQRIGLRRGDVILEVNAQPVRTAEEAARLMRRRGAVRLFVERQGRGGYISFYVN
ncbi:MAG TPA: trypsin-like peptidase domain-containing protein [Longimicrobiales bacterium]|nr:trypsin-like peptidase domain-containing protein [Longimicrobiales bacterium]